MHAEPAAWNSFVAFVAPHVDGIFLHLADHQGCSQYLTHPKVVEKVVSKQYETQHASKSLQAVQQHDGRERDCLRLIEDYQHRKGMEVSSVLLTRPDIVYSEAFPFAHLPPLNQTLYIPFGDDHGRGINDQMAVGSLPTLLRQTGWSGTNKTGYSGVAEYRFGSHISAQGLIVKRFWYEYALLRPRDIALAMAVGPQVFAWFNHNTYIWQRVVSNPKFSGDVVDANTTCSVNWNHVNLPATVPCRRRNVTYATPCLQAPKLTDKSPELVAVVCGGANARHMRQQVVYGAICATAGIRAGFYGKQCNETQRCPKVEAASAEGASIIREAREKANAQRAAAKSQASLIVLEANNQAGTIRARQNSLITNATGVLRAAESEARKNNLNLHKLSTSQNRTQSRLEKASILNFRERGELSNKLKLLKEQIQELDKRRDEAEKAFETAERNVAKVREEADREIERARKIVADGNAAAENATSAAESVASKLEKEAARRAEALVKEAEGGETRFVRKDTNVTRPNAGNGGGARNDTMGTANATTRPRAVRRGSHLPAHKVHEIGGRY